MHDQRAYYQLNKFYKHVLETHDLFQNQNAEMADVTSKHITTPAMTPTVTLFP